MRTIYRILLVLIVVSVSTSCSEEKQETKSQSQLDFGKLIVARVENTIKYRVYLLCLKHQIPSGAIEQELIDWLKTQDSEVRLYKALQENNYKTLMEGKKNEEDLDIVKKISLLSKNYNIRAKDIAALYYDFQIWCLMEELSNTGPSAME